MKNLFLFALLLIVLATIGGCNNDNTDNTDEFDNNPPIADAGEDQAGVIVGEIVILDGSGSSDPDGDDLNYSWSLVSAPGGSAATLSDPTIINPTFDADMEGSYALQLLVNDGTAESDLDEMFTIVVVPAPTVTIASPEPLTIATANPVKITGTVDDLNAVIMVDGIATLNNNGSYSENVTLSEGSNTVKVIATNSTGDGSASVDVVLHTLPGPAMSITSLAQDFTAGMNWDGAGAIPEDNIQVNVRGAITTDNVPPTVTVNGSNATITSFAGSPLCRQFPSWKICKNTNSFNFAANIILSKGAQTITAIGMDSLSGTTTVSIDGLADYCHISTEDAGVQAERGTNQSNRCHEIDGCSVYLYEGGLLARLELRNNPMPTALFNQASTEFGSGEVPPREFFVHGLKPARSLPCNKHDVCYQTAGQTQRQCDYDMYVSMRSVCRTAYPRTCPYSGLAAVQCPLYFSERLECYALAESYYEGLKAFGGDSFQERQDQYSIDR